MFEVNSIKIQYRTYTDEYHFIFEFNSDLEVIFAIKDSNINTFLTLVTEILDENNKYRDIIYKGDINNLEISCTYEFFMRRVLNIKYDDIKISFNVNEILLSGLQNFHHNFTFCSKPIIINNKIKEELYEYIKFDEEKYFDDIKSLIKISNSICVNNIPDNYFKDLKYDMFNNSEIKLKEVLERIECIKAPILNILNILKKDIDNFNTKDEKKRCIIDNNFISSKKMKTC